jgi:HNH endonuclease/AP2 domain
MTHKEEASFDDVASVVCYSPESGTFVWKDRESNKCFTSRFSGKEAGRVNEIGYRVISINNRIYLAHRLAFLLMTGDYPKDRVDHINGDRSDNRWANLRECSHAQNLANTGLWKSNSSGIKGVCWDKSRNKWQSKIKVNGKMLHLGRYDNKEDAARAVSEAYDKIYGEYARAA